VLGGTGAPTAGFCGARGTQQWRQRPTYCAGARLRAGATVRRHPAPHASSPMAHALARGGGALFGFKSPVSDLKPHISGEG